MRGREKEKGRGREKRETEKTFNLTFTSPLFTVREKKTETSG